MNQDDQQQLSENQSEISIRDIFARIRSAGKYIKSKWLSILIISMLGALLGLCYSIFKKPTYTAMCTFVLEDSKSGGIGQYGSLAALAGINLGDNGGGIFEGDNILELYKSRSMIEKTLLSSADFDKKKQLLIDRYINHSGLRNKWKDNNKLNHINFNGNPDNFDREQDSIITDLTDLFNKKVLDVTKPDKKLSIIKVEVTSEDELFSKYFTENLVKNVNDFYIKTKTKKSYQNVQILQHQADSVKLFLNSSINSVASAIDASPNANPQLTVLKVNSQKKQVDVQANTVIYSQIVQNLELAKISLRQEMPLIQVIDKPVLPLNINKAGKIKSIVLGFFLGFILWVAGVATRKVFNTIAEI